MSRGRLASVLAAAVVTAMLGGCAVFDNQRALTLDVVVDAEYADDVTTDPRDITSATCGKALDCVEAYTTTEATYLRFGSRERAADYGASLADGFVVNYIVMDFAGHVAPKHRQRWAMEALAGTWQDYHGTFPDR